MAVLFLLLVMLINVAVNFAIPGPPYCWEFDDVSLDGWTGTGFTSSLTAPPYTFGIPNWITPTNYAYVQSIAPETDKKGALTMPFSINDGDVITARLFRHVVVFDGTDRISVLFVSNDGQITTLMNPNYDQWEVEKVTCGIGYISCCTVYPCDGVLEIDGDVLTTDELVVVDYVGINSVCSTPTPPPPPPSPSPTPPSGDYDCNFDSSVCGWSLASSSDGWQWSLYGAPDPVKHPYFPVPSTPYIWIQDASAQVTSDIIIGVNERTVFSLDLYFETTAQGVDTFEVMFEDTVSGPRPPFTISTDDSGGWIRATFSSPTVCAIPALPCTGKIVISTTNIPFNGLLLAIDNFVVEL